MAMRSGRVAVVVVATLLAAGAAWIDRTPLLVGVGRLLTVDDPPAPADAIVVLGGNAETRPFVAAALYRQHLAPRVLLFQHRIDRIAQLGLSPSSEELYRKVLESQGVSAGDIDLLPGIVDSTRDEAASLRRYLTRRPARRIVIVTSPEHTRRARWIFKRALGPDVEVRMAAARHPDADERRWWTSDETALAFVHEYLKLPYWWFVSMLPSAGSGA